MEDFDWEKWKVDNPPDYLKVFKFIMETPDFAQTDIFKLLCRILKLHIPKTLYKFYAFTNDDVLNQKKIDTLLHKEVFCSEIKNLNDPLDSKFIYYDPSRLMRFEALWHCRGKIFDDLSAYSRVACFTACDQMNLSMWANYANNHSGYCVSYQMSEVNSYLREFIFPVQYMNTRYDFTDFLEKQVECIESEIARQESNGEEAKVNVPASLIHLCVLAVNIKGAVWMHEQEYRCSISSAANISPNIHANPKEIFIGMKCPLELASQLKEIGAELHVPVYRMICDDNMSDFSLISIKE